MLAHFPVPCGAESQNSWLCFLNSQHFVPLANVTAFKGAEKTREIYTVNHFCAETAEEGLSLAGKHRRLCAAVAKKLICMCPPHSLFSSQPLSLSLHPHDLSWRRCQEDPVYPTGGNWTLHWKHGEQEQIFLLFLLKLQLLSPCKRVCAAQRLKMKALIIFSLVDTYCDCTESQHWDSTLRTHSRAANNVDE